MPCQRRVLETRNDASRSVDGRRADVSECESCGRASGLRTDVRPESESTMTIRETDESVLRFVRYVIGEKD